MEESEEMNEEKKEKKFREISNWAELRDSWTPLAARLSRTLARLDASDWCWSGICSALCRAFPSESGLEELGSLAKCP